MGGSHNPWVTDMGRSKKISMHYDDCTEMVHLQNKSTDDESCDELELQGEKLDARREKAPGKLQAYVIPRSPFRPCRTGDGLLRSAQNIPRYASYIHGII